MSARLRISSLGLLVWLAAGLHGYGREIEYRLLATNRTSSMEQEMNAVAADGYRIASVMGGQTAFGGPETVVVMSRNSGDAVGDGFEYRLLATSQTSTMQDELSAAGRDGFGYVGQTVFETRFGGEEVVVILERPRSGTGVPLDYLLLATRRTSTMESELSGAGREGYEVMGLTVAETRFGGPEVVAILSRPSVP